MELPYLVILFTLIIEREETQRKKSRRTMVDHTEFQRSDNARKKGTIYVTEKWDMSKSLSNASLQSN
jgi:hypothetical protein